MEEFFNQYPNLSLEQYEEIMDEVPITNWGRGYVSIIFTSAVLKHRAILALGILNYWLYSLIGEEILI